MNDNCDMNLFNPENMEIKPGKIGSFIPKYSKLIVSERDDSTYCIEFEIAGRDYEFNMSKEQAVKLARGIFSLSGEERPQGEWVTVEDSVIDGFKECSNCGEKAEWLDGGGQFLCNFCPNCGADMRGDKDGK